VPFIGDSDEHGADFQFWLNGVEGQEIKTTDRTIEISENNRAFVLEKEEEIPFWAYQHKYLGGSVSFDVDISDVGCGCRAGIYLTTLDDGACSWNPLEGGATPACSTIDLMEGSIWGIKTQSSPCADGACPESQMCTVASNRDSVGPGL